MAKKKEIVVSENNTIKELIKKYGEVISTGAKVLQKRKDLKILKFSPSLDLMLNGGLQEGTWTVISGPPKSGKTTSILQLVANGQKEDRKCIYIDAENRLKAYNLEGIDGLDPEKMDIIAPEDKPLSAEALLSIAEAMYKMPEYEGAILVIDSTSSMLPQAELDADVSGTLRANFPKLMAHWIKKNAHTIVSKKIIVLLITHYITNTSGYGKQKNPDGGLYMQYQADTILDIKTSEDWEENGKVLGKIITWKLTTSGLGASSKECRSYIKFGTGIDFVQEYINLGVDLGLIAKAGAWYTNTFLSDQEGYKVEDHKYQGMVNLKENLSENPEALDLLFGKIKEILS